MIIQKKADFQYNVDSHKEYEKLVSWFKNAEVADYEIVKLSKNRTKRQNRLYWGLIIDSICRHSGENPTVVHETVLERVKDMNLVDYQTFQTLSGREVSRVTSTNFSTSEWDILIQTALDICDEFIDETRELSKKIKKQIERLF